MDELMRMAGVDLGLDIREGLGRFDLDEMRRAFRRDKLIEVTGREMNKMAPENSEPGYSMTGGYQPEVIRALTLRVLGLGAVFQFLGRTGMCQLFNENFLVRIEVRPLGDGRRKRPCQRGNQRGEAVLPLSMNSSSVSVDWRRRRRSSIWPVTWSQTQHLNQVQPLIAARCGRSGAFGGSMGHLELSPEYVGRA